LSSSALIFMMYMVETHEGITSRTRKVAHIVLTVDPHKVRGVICAAEPNHFAVFG